MNINNILAEGENVVYRPKLHWFAYFNLAKLIRNLTTTIFLSDRRFFHGHGLLRRHTRKIETINVTESIVGRIFGYGTVFVSGTGAGSITMRYICKPFELQRQIRSIQE